LTNIATAVSAALRAVSICTPAGLVTPVALAQSPQQAVLSVDIPAQPLTEALAKFSRETGLQLVYVSEVVQDQKSHPASAGLSADQALAQLLQGTGLRFEYLTPHSIRILAAPAVSSPQPAEIEVQQVIVTANRREENLQEVPFTVQVLTGETLAALNARTFDDFLNYLPGITAHGVGPGQSNIYIRGLATTVTGIQGSGVTGTFPNVSVYLDEQSVQLPSRNLDVYTADLERIEILEGPQGTLFGAGAQAGVVRYITNKPKLNVTEAMVDAGYATTAHGGPSANFDATVNIPLLPDKFAVRAVVYDERRGGYINNIPATFARADSDLGISYAYARGAVPVNSVVINNSNISANDINTVDYQGVRVEALCKFDEDWSALIAQSYQNIDVSGVFTEMAADSLGVPQPGLTVQLFNPSYNKDRFENTALTIEGRVGALKLLYAGAYLVRNVEQVQDYTAYARGVFVDYYQCVNPQPGNPATAQCFTPSSTWQDVERNTHQSHELRLTTPANWRLRGVGGLFYEDTRIQEQTDWLYLTALPYFNPLGPPTGYFTLNGSTVQPNGNPVTWLTPGAVLVPRAVTSINPHTRPPGDGFFNDITRGYKQKAGYASIDFDLVPKALTLTVGTRYFSTNSVEVGSDAGSFGCRILFNAAPPNPCVNHSNFQNLDAKGFDRTFSGFRSRANLSWKFKDDALLYYTWSQGFRAGGFNRGAPSVGGPLFPGPFSWQAQANAHGGLSVPVDYAPDNLTNNEIGWKTTWAGQRIQWNGAVYQEDWDHVQIGLLATGLVANLIVTNGGSYRVRGVETSVAARITSGITLDAGAAWNQSALVKEATFLWADGTVIDFTTLQTASRQKLSNPAGTLGSPLAGAPPFQGHIRLRYEFPLGGYDAFAQIGAVHQSHSLSTTDRLGLDVQGNSTAYDLPAFTTYDAALGVGRDAWRLQIYAQNLTDTRAELYANYAQYFKAVTVSRPRTIGLVMTYKSGR